jgi:hypothetical protein
LQPHLPAAKTNCRVLKPHCSQSRFRDMQNNPRSEAISRAERELDETNGLVTQQYRVVKRLKRLGADTKEAILLLLNLLDLQQSREQRLSYLRMRGTGTGAGRVFHRPR